MKKSTSLFNVRTIISFSLIALAAAILFTSCKKDGTPSNANDVSDEEVAEAVSQSVSASSGGLVTQTESSADMSGTITLSCGSSSDTAIVGQSLAGATVTYDYSLNFNRSLICANGIPSQFNFNFTGNSSYTAPRMSSADNSSAQFVITGLQPSATAYVVNESYMRNGTQQSKVRLQRAISSTITITSTDMTVSKSSKKILSGTANVQFAGSVTGGASVSRGGIITFLGNSQATLVLNNGGTYQLQW